ncbi:hypothetical protein QBC38DRAFT_505122 [Podospora fimiseda]|uniref:Transglutaminase-like domain-containing protein n=1 Tax=Podospora fimiseda TaxID=252190 RepID=A0AAN6YRN0_9PEZI|nr:hypothetical protein QBC38DRAFT_505122 [Podospora fimiseda]
MATTFRSSDLITRTTTGISDLLSFKQRSDRQETAWPDPERSVGRFVKRFGKVSCWEATGPARDAFNEIAPDIKEYLDRCVEPISAWVTWSVFMFGKSPKTANPTIVFCCEVATHRKEVKNIIIESGLLDGYQGLKTAHMPQAPDFQHLVPLAGEDGRLSTCTTEAFASQGYAAHRSGMRIFVGDSAIPATIGGIIQVGDQFFYTTAGHVFQPRKGEWQAEASGSDTDDDMEIDGFDASDFGEDDDDGEQEVEGFESDMAASRFQRTTGKEPEFSSQVPGTYVDSGSSHLPTKVLTMGSPFLTSFDFLDQDYNLDYALMEITHPIHHSVNRVMYRPIHGFLRSINVEAPINNSPSGETVLAITARGVIEGKIHGTPIYSRHPLGSHFLSAFKVSFHLPLEVGDCGSWVVNAETNELYGHIVAGDPGLGTAIVVSFQSIFEDIECRTGQPPKLPSVRQATSQARYLLQHSETPLNSSSSEGGPEWAREIATQYKSLLRTRLAKTLSKGKREHGSVAQDGLPSYASSRAGDILPRPHTPNEQEAGKFRLLLLSLSRTILRWEDPGLMDKALRLVPLDLIYAEAEEESEVMLAKSMSLGEGHTPEWSYQDCVIQSLLRWFKRSFFTWVNNPQCEKCSNATVSIGMTAPTPKESAEGALRCELYRCSEVKCQAYVRFPRYNNPYYLLRTRRGRVGEWANCFGLFCRALGAKTRWVWNSEDHVWLEVFSVHQQRWVHVEPAEQIWDNPRLYCEGWGNKLGYCIAFSVDGATDVTRRYVRRAEFAAERKRCPEPVLRHILQEITTLRRSNMEWEKAALEKQDAEEERELCGFIVTEIRSGLTKCAQLKMEGAKGREKDVGRHQNFNQLVEGSSKARLLLSRKSEDKKSPVRTEEANKAREQNTNSGTTTTDS